MKKLDGKLRDYMEFKISQFIRVTGFDIRQENAKDKLKEQVSLHLRDWLKEAIAAGC